MPDDSAQPDAPALVDRLLDEAAGRRASDVHFDPGAQACAVAYRVDGMLEPAATLDAAAGRAVVTRLMVLAKLLTYRRDIPQEGRLAVPLESVGRVVEMRLSIMPTTHGLRAVVRMPADLTRPQSLEALMLPAPVDAMLRRFADADTGLLLLTGPAGSGKTTTIYALLDHIRTRHPGLSIVTLEDPVERDLPGVTQIQVSPHGELTYERALRSMLRQDPQVLALGEVRDRETASLAIGAALSGHRLIATLHAGSCATAIARLVEMGIEPYQVTSAVFGVVAQRLLRRADGSGEGGYLGRVPIAEGCVMDAALGRAVLDRSDAAAMNGAIAGQEGHQTLRESADAAVASGLTDAEEVTRVLGA